MKNSHFGILRTIVGLGILTFMSQNASAQKLNGHLYDAGSGEPLTSATISLKSNDQQYNTKTELDGGFTFNHLPKGSYKIQIKFIGYKDFDSTVYVNAEEVKLPHILLSSSASEIETVVVRTSGGNGSDRFNRNVERVSPFVMNTLSQRAIELSPDVTVANSLQRMSGVTIQRSSSGEGRYAIIRGMDQRYNTTLINGIKIPSPDDRYRYVPMDLFPSDMLERLEVIKALTPNMEGDAVGGIMNLIMKNAPQKQQITGFIAGGSSTLFTGSRPFQSFDRGAISSKSPRDIHGADYVATQADFPSKNLNLYKASPVNLQAGLSYGNRFLNNKLGMIIGLSYQNNFRGSDQIMNTQYPGARVLPPSITGKSDYTDNYPLFNSAIERHYSTQNRRMGINNKWDYQINKNNSISLYNFYVRMDEYQARTSGDTDVNTNLGQIKTYVRTRWEIQDIYNSTLHGEHHLSNRFEINWNAAYSIAKKRQPDFAQYEVDYKKNSDNTTSFVQVNDMTRIWNRNQDKDLAGYLNMIYNSSLFGKKLDISWGGMYRHKDRFAKYLKYDMNADPKEQAFTVFDSATYSFGSNSEAGGQEGTGRNYDITEKISAGYGQLAYYPSANWQLTGGVRVEHTDQNYSTNLSSGVNAKSGHIYYTDVLPSLHVKYLMGDRQNIWLSYFRSLVRPSFAELIPQSVPADENDLGYDQQGNPFIKHTTADNIDLRYGLFPKGADQLLVGAFYKRIHNPIEVTFSHYNVFGGTTSPGANILTPSNIGDVNNYGVEFQFTKFIGNFGVNMNYTYTHSATTTSKYYYMSRKSLGLADTTINRDQTRPMQGQAKHIGNLSLIYKSAKLGLDAQIAYVYTGERIALVNTFYNMDTWQSPYSQLDFSFEKKIVKWLSIYGKVNNLTNSKTRYFIKMPYLIGSTLNAIPAQDEPSKSIFVQRDIYKISYLFGFRFKL